MVQYGESVYKFTDPIRYFKANDPYYFEVDNIPLKQLQENCNWLKDQLGKVSQEGISEVLRSDIQELKPYAVGGDRLVRVKPGRYTARVNDASIKEPLSFLTQIAGQEVATLNSYSAQVPNNVNLVLSNTLDKFKSSLAENSLGLNGLESRLFTWPVINGDAPLNGSGVILDTDSNYVNYSQDQQTGLLAGNLPTVISEAIVWARNSNINSFTLFTGEAGTIQGSDGFALLPLLESHFIKYWRGVARTAVVDIPQELSVEVPAFDESDFSYIDENGNTVDVTGVESRIDLVFIYTKPVDTSSTTILKPSGKEVITKPQLGIIQGAGIRVTDLSSSDPKYGTQSYVGDTHKILASPGDASNENIGFDTSTGSVRGTFPSPDDLLNLAPLLSEKLEDEAIELVGQSILPLAYVFVQNTGTPLTTGAFPVQPTDVIDIRPFFRTAELTYNERAGIAGAMPQLSLANPAVGKAHLDAELKLVYDDVLSKIPQLQVSQSRVSHYDVPNGNYSKQIFQETDATGNSIDLDSNGVANYGLFQRDYSDEYVNGGYITGTNIIFNSFEFRLNDMIVLDNYLNNLDIANGNWLNLFNDFRVVGTFKIYSEIMGRCGPAEDEEAYLRVYLNGDGSRFPFDDFDISNSVLDKMAQYDDDALATLATPNESITQSLNPIFPARGIAPELVEIKHTHHAGMSQASITATQKSSLVSIVDIPLFKQSNGDILFIVDRLKKNCLSDRYYLGISLTAIKLFPK